MDRIHKVGKLILIQSKIFLVSVLFLFACSGVMPQANSPFEAIEQIQTLAGFPKSDVNYIGTTTMGNSPDGHLEVDLYQDEAGRKFFVDPNANIVVEIDARDLLPVHSPAATNAVAISTAELEKRAGAFVRSAVPNFSSLESDLSYEAGAKGDNFFFTWRMSGTQIYFMPPFIQVAMTSSGDIFAFINTISVSNP